MSESDWLSGRNDLTSDIQRPKIGIALKFL